MLEVNLCSRDDLMMNISIWFKKYLLLIWIFFIFCIIFYVKLEQQGNNRDITEGIGYFI
jgi:type II secretory pathway component PulF